MKYVILVIVAIEYIISWTYNLLMNNILQIGSRILKKKEHYARLNEITKKYGGR